MTVYGGVNTGKLRPFLAVKIERRRHDGAANVFCFRALLQPVAVVHHLLAQEIRCLFRLAVFLGTRLNPQCAFDQLPHRDQMPFLLV
ncbi:hypothetical protein D3C81_2050680 [compost metagenome]